MSQFLVRESWDVAARMGASARAQRSSTLLETKASCRAS